MVVVKWQGMPYLVSGDYEAGYEAPNATPDTAEESWESSFYVEGVLSALLPRKELIDEMAEEDLEELARLARIAYEAGDDFCEGDD